MHDKKYLGCCGGAGAGLLRGLDEPGQPGAGPPHHRAHRPHQASRPQVGGEDDGGATEDKNYLAKNSWTLTKNICCRLYVRRAGS